MPPLSRLTPTAPPRGEPRVLASPFGRGAEQREAERVKMRLPKNNRLLPFARQLRRELTPQERKLWYLFLRKYPVKFYRQKIISSYIVDFYCSKAKLAVELDGSQHYDEIGIEYDAERTKQLERFGVSVMRFTNFDVDQNFESVCRTIDSVVRSKFPDA